jgi:hypothetical protein
MKQFLFAAAVLLVSSLACPGARAAGLGEIKTVYVLPMSGGLDQYLAVELTTGAVLQVVTDPQKADVVFTDHLGESFEQSLVDLYGGKGDDTTKSDPPDNSPRNFARTGMQGQRGRGTAFLVDRQTHDVIWSVYERPKDTTPTGLRRTAGQIASKLSRAIKGK